MLIVFFTMPVFNLAQAQIIENGSFENAQINPGVTFQELPAGSNAIDHWTIENGTIDYIGGLWPPSNGARSIDMTGTSAGTLSQSFSTVSGAKYLIEFDLSGNPGDLGSCGSSIIKELKVSAGNNSTIYTFDVTGQTLNNMGWETRAFEFDAIETTTTLLFASLTPGKCGPAIDNVKIIGICDCAGTPNGTAVVDDCGVCLEPTDPQFNACLTDCSHELSALYQFFNNADDISGNNFHGEAKGSAKMDGFLHIPKDTESHVVIPSEALDGALDFTVACRVRFNEFNTWPNPSWKSARQYHY